MRAALAVLALLLAGCASPEPPPASTTTTQPAPSTTPALSSSCDPDAAFPCATWDLDAKGVPRVVHALHLDFALVGKVSRFRSGFGHDYTQGSNETCRSMKHDFVPRDLDLDPATWEIRSPVEGRIVRAEEEHSGLGTQVWIAPREWPEARVILFHVALDEGKANVSAGERIGHHASNRTANDVAVLVATPGGPRLASYFDAMDDAAFAPFAQRGLARSDFVIEQAWRDARPMTCQGEAFTGGDASRDWIVLPP